MPIRAWALVTGLAGQPGAIVRFAVVFELLRWLILAPLGAGLLRLSLERWGRCSVGNFEIVAFLLSPTGLAGLIGVGIVNLVIVYLQIAGLMLLLAARQAQWWSVFPMLGRCLPRLIGLGLRQFAVLLALLVPFAAALAFVPTVLWTGRDLNGLIVLRPPVFWTGVAVAAFLMTVYALIGGYLLLRWLLALPVILFEPAVRGGEALRLSRRRTSGRVASMLRLVTVWLLTIVVLSVVIMGGLRLGSAWLLNRADGSMPVLLTVTAIVLLLHLLSTALLSIIGSASFAALLLALYRETLGRPLTQPELPGTGRGPLVRVPARWAIVGVPTALIVTVGLLCHALLARVRMHEPLAITAHRAGAAVAPENTVAAIRKAIGARADWAEIDVQRTADGAVVVLHDSDLDRVAGLRQRVADSTLEQIKAIDIGSRVGTEFQGEKIPTLDEIIAAAGDRIRLNIELKPNGKSDVAPLVQAVLESMRQAGITGRSRLCSQSYDGIQLARQLEPGLAIGFIAGGRIGDLAGLNVNFLMVSRRLATRQLADSARLRGIEVHAWTINDPNALAPLLDRGVANVITDDPAAMRQRLEEIQQLSPAERLLLRARHLLSD